MVVNNISSYLKLMRLEKPIGIALLLWPTLWALWLAAAGKPDFYIVLIFSVGVLLMRSAGCVINDYFDRHFDAQVKRTADRPLATFAVSGKSALILFLVLLGAAFSLVLLCNRLTVQLAFIGGLLALIYPLLKRFTHWPQLGLGMAFSWGVPMAFAAETGAVNQGWMVFAACIVWPVIYDTFYAMADQPDDQKIGIKSTAILFGPRANKIVGAFQILFLLMLVGVGRLFGLHPVYYFGLIIVAGLFGYQQFLISENKQQYLQAFKHNQWVGLTIFLAILLNYL